MAVEAAYGFYAPTDKLEKLYAAWGEHDSKIDVPDRRDYARVLAWVDQPLAEALLPAAT
jgi:hypothetical protein